MIFVIINNPEHVKNLFPILEYRDQITLQSLPAPLVHILLVMQWQWFNLGMQMLCSWRHRVQHWCIINCRILQVNYDQWCPASFFLLIFDIWYWKLAGLELWPQNIIQAHRKHHGHLIVVEMGLCEYNNVVDLSLIIIMCLLSNHKLLVFMVCLSCCLHQSYTFTQDRWRF